MAATGLVLTMLAGCTSSSAPPQITTATSTTVVIASPTPLPSPTRSSPPASASISRSARPSASPSSAAPVLDATSKAWFSGVCLGQKALQKLASPKTSGTVAQLQAQVVSAYQALSASAATTAITLAGLAAPTVPEGSTAKLVRVGVFRAIAAGYAAGATTIKNSHPTTTAELNTAVNQVEAGIQAAVGKIAADAPAYPEGYAELVLALPACSGLS